MCGFASSWLTVLWPNPCLQLSWLSFRADRSLIETVLTTPANMNDGKAGCHIVPDDPGAVYADSAYRGDRFRRAVADKGGVARTPVTGIWAHKDQSQEEVQATIKSINDPIHAVRARIEKIFGTCKRSYGLRRIPYRGLAKGNLFIHLVAIAYNLKRGKRLC